MPKFKKYWRWYFLVSLAVAAYVIWSAVFWVEARGLTFIYFFDVGQGDAIFIEAPNGNQVLIDGGPDRSVLARLGEVMPFWDRSIDLIVLTHPHADHLDGLLEVLKRYDIGMVLESGVNHVIPEYGQWHEIIRSRDIPTLTALRGQMIFPDDNISIVVLAPFRSFDRTSVKNIHDAAVVLELKFGSASALLMSDAESRLERQLLASASPIKADVLKIGHHGSKTSSLEEFLVGAGPKFAVISSGRKNRYGHPGQEVLDRLGRLGIKTYRTDQDGTLTFVSNGQTFSRY